MHSWTSISMRPVPVVLTLLLLAPLALALSPPSAPMFPGAVQGAAVGTIELNWTAPTSSGASPIGGYRIYRSLTSSGLVHYLDIGNVLAFTDSGLPDGATRYYRFSAVNGDGEGPLSPVVNASAKAPPTIPRNVAAAAIGRGNLTLTWDLPQYNGSADVTSYNVYRSLSENGTYSLLGSPTQRRQNDTGHGDNETFWYAISAVNVHGEGPRTLPRPARTPSVPGAPGGLTVATTPGLGITIDWERPFDDGGISLSYYRVYRVIGSQPEKVWAAVGSTTTVATDRDCPLATTCVYRVTAVNVIGASGFSNSGAALGDSVLELL